jgi:hypothetical protein
MKPLIIVGVLLSILAALLVVSVVVADDRDPQWRSVRDAYIAAHPDCEFCGAPAKTVHHKKPFHVHRELELDPANLTVLCDPCHATIAHLDRHTNSWNPLIEEEAALHKAMVAARPKTDKEAEAFVRRFKKCFDPANYANSP